MADKIQHGCQISVNAHLLACRRHRILLNGSLLLTIDEMLVIKKEMVKNVSVLVLILIFFT